MPFANARQYLKLLTGRDELHGAVETLARTFLLEASLADDRPPTWAETKQLASSRSVVEIRAVAGDRGLGHLSASRSGLAAHVRGRMSRSEFKFTVTHEVAHTAFFRLDLRPPERRVPWTPGEEIACDQLARALLLPFDWLRRSDDGGFFLSDAGERLSGWAREHEVPVWQVVSRCAEASYSGAMAAARWKREGSGLARVSAFSKARDCPYYIPVRKRSFRDDDADRNSYVWRFIGRANWQFLETSVSLGALSVPCFVAGRGKPDGSECVCLYRPVSQ
jgi:hypothetical protein